MEATEQKNIAETIIDTMKELGNVQTISAPETANDLTAPELLPCPFCGGPAEVMNWMGGLVGCMNCALARRDKKSWNRRADTPARAGMIRDQVREKYFDQASGCYDIGAMLDDLAALQPGEPARAGMGICGKCEGTGVDGHPDSGYTCDCNGGMVRAALQPGEAQGAKPVLWRRHVCGEASVAVCPVCDISGCHHIRATNDTPPAAQVTAAAEYNQESMFALAKDAVRNGVSRSSFSQCAEWTHDLASDGEEP